MYMINGQIVDTGCRQVALWGLVNRGLPPLPLRRPMTCPMTAHWKRYPSPSAFLFRVHHMVPGSEPGTIWLNPETTRNRVAEPGTESNHG